MNKRILILGGGPAGLAVGYYLKKSGFEVTILEASDTVGGNCRTIPFENHRFDTGAHRFHDKIPHITNEIKQLLGDELLKIDVPSAIKHDNRFIQFPIRFGNLIQNTGFFDAFIGGLSFIKSKFNKFNKNDFESMAINNYGRHWAKMFLLDYSEKLWGCEPSQLDISVSGKRLKGFNLKSLWTDKNTLDGSFYYPKMGIGSIIENLSKNLIGNILTNHKVNHIQIIDNLITQIKTGNGKSFTADYYINTLPLPLLLSILDAPSKPNTASIKFRDVTLFAQIIKRKQMSPYASLYFPSNTFPYTRIVEPKNRSLKMSPENETLLVAEIPCRNDEEIDINKIARSIQTKFKLKPEEIGGATSIRLKNAYPILTQEAVQQTQTLLKYLQNFTNLKTLGRNGNFEYTHIHDIMNQAKIISQEFRKMIL